eukprot:gene25544-11188_t
MKDTKRQREEMKQALRQAGATEQNMSRDVATAVKAQNRLLERVQIIATEDAKNASREGGDEQGTAAGWGGQIEWMRVKSVMTRAVKEVMVKVAERQRGEIDRVLL